MRLLHYILQFVVVVAHSFAVLKAVCLLRRRLSLVVFMLIAPCAVAPNRNISDFKCLNELWHSQAFASSLTVVRLNSLKSSCLHPFASRGLSACSFDGFHVLGTDCCLVSFLMSRRLAVLVMFAAARAFSLCFWWLFARLLALAAKLSQQEISTRVHLWVEAFGAGASVVVVR